MRAVSYVVGIAAMLLGALGAGASTAHAAAGCTVTYTIRNDWGAGFTADLTITNNGPAINGWLLTYSYGGGQTIQSGGWGGTWSQSGANVSVHDAGYNAQVATNQTLTNIGTNGNENPSGHNPNPTVFALNGVNCTGPHQPPTVSITSPAPGAAFTAPATIGLTASASAQSGSTITQVAYFDGTTQIGSATTSPYSFTWQNVAAGDHNVTAVATDSAGATGTSAPLGIHVAASPSVLVSATTLAVQAGGTATFGVSLSSAPSANVTVTVARSSGDTDVTIQSGSSLTFTPTNSGTAQTVTVAAASANAPPTTAVITASAPGFVSATVSVTKTAPLPLHDQRFIALYQKIKDPSNGYFSPLGIPFHSVETLIVEAPDYGHETTSEAFSFWLWLEAAYGRVTKNWTPFNNAWAAMEQFIIPSHADQPTNNFYTPSKPATFAPELDSPAQYPATLDSSVTPGQDPLASELQTTYGTPDIYGMHWLLDVDNKYGFGHCGDGTTKPAFINTFQRGPEESVWRTVPQPECETFTFGAGANGGYLPLFVAGSTPAPQWRYTDAPDADARAVQAAYWALTWATQQGNASAVSATVAKAAKLGDYLRYALFDKYFKQIGNCVGPTACPAGSGRSSADFLLGWYYAWGGCLPQGSGCSWAWRIGDGVAHFGYQNPIAAWALSNVSALQPKSPTAVSDWSTSLQRRRQQLGRPLRDAAGGRPDVLRHVL
jgi:Glycosyl hydrolase family 48/Cellulose binding domain/Bacterial Ig domain